MRANTARLPLSQIRIRALARFPDARCCRRTANGMVSVCKRDDRQRSCDPRFAPLETACPHAVKIYNRKNGLWAGRLQNLIARARSEDERPRLCRQTSVPHWTFGVQRSAFASRRVPTFNTQLLTINFVAP